MTDRQRDPLPEGYQFGDARLPMSLLTYDRFHLLRPHGIDPHKFLASIVDYAATRAAYETVTNDCPSCGMAMWSGGEKPVCVSPYCHPESFGVAPGDVRAAGAGQTGETLTTTGTAGSPDDDSHRNDSGAPIPCTHSFLFFDVCWMSYFCRCGARRDRSGEVFERESVAMK